MTIKRPVGSLPPRIRLAKRRRIRDAVIKGCHDMSEIMVEIEGEYNPLEEEVDRMPNGEEGQLETREKAK